MRERGRPALSVVVPLHDTAQYVEECIDSLVTQEVSDLEVVLVDDASTDDSLQVAVRAARGRLRGLALRTERRGTGGARNVGARLATGRYLTFLDSDDAVLPWGYAELLSVLDSSGSDFATASTLRGPTLDQAEVPRWIAAVHRQQRIGVEVSEFPEITRDILTANKVFRRSFWKASGVQFPERLRYEDQVAVEEAYLRAATVDVLPQPVYFWRVRPDGSSITQGRAQLANLQDRVVTKLLTSRIVEESGNHSVAKVWRRYGLLGDLPEYLRHLPHCGTEYWTLLRQGLRLIADHDVVAGSNLHVTQRLAASLVLDGDRQAATAMVEHIQGEERALPVELRDGVALARVPDEIDAREQPPINVRRLRVRDVGWGFDVDWIDDCGGRLTVAGTPRAGGFTNRLSVTCSLVGAATGREVNLAAEKVGERRLAVEIDPAALPAGEGTWNLRFNAWLGDFALPRVPGAWEQVASAATKIDVTGATAELVTEGRRGLALHVPSDREAPAGCSASYGATPSTPRPRQAPAEEQQRDFELPRP